MWSYDYDHVAGVAIGKIVGEYNITERTTSTSVLMS